MMRNVRKYSKILDAESTEEYSHEKAQKSTKNGQKSTFFGRPAAVLNLHEKQTLG